MDLTEFFVNPQTTPVWRRRALQVAKEPEAQPWVTGVLLDGEMPVGRAGFHGPPEQGMVEVGYEIDPLFRHRGYAPKALDLLINRSRQNSTVHTLRASIRPDNAASLAVIAPYNFAQTGEEVDEIDGLEYVFDLDVS